MHENNILLRSNSTKEGNIKKNIRALASFKKYIMFYCNIHYTCLQE